MAKGSRKARRELFDAQQKDAWWRTSWLLAEIHNCAIAQIQAWGGAKDAKPKQPLEMNPLEKSTAVVSESGTVTDHATESAFAFAASREAARSNGK